MSVSQLWYASAVSEEFVARWRRVFDDALAGLARDATVQSGLRTWATAGDIRTHVAGHNPLGDNEVAVALNNLFWQAALDWGEIVDVFDEVNDPGGEPDRAGFFMTRKLCPLAALLVGLGWERARRLPGICGNHLLDAAETKRLAPAIDAAFALTGGERRETLARMAAWVATGDATVDLDELLDTLPRLHRYAVDHGLGLVSFASVPG